MNHKFLRNLLPLILAVATMFTLSAPIFAYTGVSSWAKADLKEAELLGILPPTLKDADMKQPITRQEMCGIATLAYEKLTGNSPTPNRTDYFTDTQDPLISAAYEIGIVKGYEDGTFLPDALLTRQEYFVIVSNLNRCVGMPIHITQDYLKGFLDRKDVSYWAESATQEVVGLGIVNGTINESKQLVLLPKEYTNSQEAVVMFLRSYKNADQFLKTDWLTKEQIDAMAAAAKKEAASEEAGKLAEYALGFVGKAYVFGATGPNSFDCSGFTRYVYKHFGYSINRIANDQIKNGVAVDWAKLKPGDLICFSNTYSSSEWITHVGIYIGDGKMVHAANSKRGVTVDSITSGYYYSHRAAARRILK